MCYYGASTILDNPQIKNSVISFLQFLVSHRDKVKNPPCDHGAADPKHRIVDHPATPVRMISASRSQRAGVCVRHSDFRRMRSGSGIGVHLRNSISPAAHA